ncbi:hypothetical protein [Chlorogloeopsis sp. ULAP01]|nr:hypothetical protein [Chlorogloeopsis sp. ULAP01]
MVSQRTGSARAHCLTSGLLSTLQNRNQTTGARCESTNFSRTLSGKTLAY